MSRDDRQVRLLSLAVALIGLSCGCGGLRAPSTAAHDFPTLTADELFEVALFQARRGDFFRAEQYLVAARSQGYDDATATYWLVRVCVYANRYHSALHHAHDRLSRKPDDWRLRLIVASLHEALGEIGKAREELEGMLRADPNRALVHYRLGTLYGDSASSRDAARAHFLEYLGLEPSGEHSAEVRATLGRWASSERVADAAPLEDTP